MFKPKFPWKAPLGRRWQPRYLEHGRVFCSPGCGGRCLAAAFRMARQNSEAMALKMGPGWQPKVWENLGWHWEVANGEISISQNGANAFTCYFNSAVQFVARGRTAAAALKHARAAALDCISAIRLDLDRTR